jgi:hypothetical protein
MVSLDAKKAGKLRFRACSGKKDYRERFAILVVVVLFVIPVKSGAGVFIDTE